MFQTSHNYADSPEFGHYLTPIARLSWEPQLFFFYKLVRHTTVYKFVILHKFLAPIVAEKCAKSRLNTPFASRFAHL